MSETNRETTLDPGVEDLELCAMRDALRALTSLETAEARGRVLKYLAERCGLPVPGKRGAHRGDEVPEEAVFESLADLHGAASPDGDASNALVGGYWFQGVQKNADFTAQQVNDELKNLGCAVGNITMAFNSLRERKPALVLQVQKSGSSKQARKRYKLTQAGISEVQRMLRGSETE